MNNENNVKEIVNSIDKIRDLIDTIISSMNKFRDQRQLIIFSYLTGYFVVKNNNLFTKEKILDILNIFLENDIPNNENEIIINLANIFNLFNENPDPIIKENIDQSNSNYNIINSNDNINNNLNNSNNINNSNIINTSHIILRDKNNNNKIKNNGNSNDINTDSKNKSNNNEKNEDNKIENKIDNSLNNINNNNKNKNNLDSSKSNSFPIKMKKCEICLEEFNEYDSLNYELKCGCILHDKCFDDYIKNSVENNNIPILCPNCKTEIHPNLIYDSLINSDNKGLVQKYEKFSMDNYLLNHKDSYSCCPTPGCEYMFFFEQGENHFTCPLCHKDYCLFCKNEWHKGMSCQEYMDSKDVNKLDEKFNKFVRGQNYKICPKCGIWVEKTEGCNHMRCRCGADFCYKCGKLIPPPLHDCPCWNNNPDGENFIRRPLFRNVNNNIYFPPHGLEIMPPHIFLFGRQPNIRNNMNNNNDAQLFGNNNLNRPFDNNNQGLVFGENNNQNQNVNNLFYNPNNQGGNNNQVPNQNIQNNDMIID